VKTAILLSAGADHGIIGSRLIVQLRLGILRLDGPWRYNSKVVLLLAARHMHSWAGFGLRARWTSFSAPRCFSRLPADHAKLDVFSRFSCLLSPDRQAGGL
jgi:hypothetical protein